MPSMIDLWTASSCQECDHYRFYVVLPLVHDVEWILPAGTKWIKCVLIDKAWPMCHSTPRASYLLGLTFNGKCMEDQVIPISQHGPFHSIPEQDLNHRRPCETIGKTSTKHRTDFGLGGSFVYTLHSSGEVSGYSDNDNLDVHAVLPGRIWNRPLSDWKYAFLRFVLRKWSNKEFEAMPRWHLVRLFWKCYHLQEGMK
jgi:hypothetical protein